MSENVKYKVSFATDSRAEYGIVRKYLALMNADDSINLEILATGSMLDEEFGMSARAIESDGFKVSFKAPLPNLYSTDEQVIDRLASALDQFNHFFARNRYDLLIILGDRYEMLGTAIAAAMHRIPILHLHGGEATYGNYDEFIRHCITKMSLFHFTSCEEYRRRVIQLGESPERVFNLGSLGVENCLTLDESKVSPTVKCLSGEGYYVVLFHPETLSSIDALCQIRCVLNACDLFRGDDRLVFIGSNADSHSAEIRAMVADYVKSRRNVLYFENLAVNDYLYLVKHSKCIIGNSSSGIIEAPSLSVATINVGNRQRGRVRAKSVIDVGYDSQQIAESVKNVSAIEADCFSNPYYKPNTAYSYYRTTLNLLGIMGECVVHPKEFYNLSTDLFE